jgi:hypothetical protein
MPNFDHPSKCDVFITFRNDDRKIAIWLSRRLQAEGFRPFCSPETLQQLGESDYRRAIDTALQSAQWLIAVGSKAENFASGWVRYEWSSFQNEILSGRKPHGNLLVLSHGVRNDELPLALRQHQVIDYHDNAPHKALQSICEFLRARTRH